MTKPSIPKGTRDFNSDQVNKRQYIISVIKKYFSRFGFQPIETPSFEKSETLLGKYGEEGDRLIFRVLNSGEKVKHADLSALEEKRYAKFSNSLSEKALRYDLTVPFARFVVQHRNELEFPFKRYQIQPVWRADRPQLKQGRFQEFYQCDADVIGSKSLWQEVEFVQLYDEVFKELNLSGTTIKINNRKVLSGIAEIIGASDKLIDFTVALDKLDKIGEDKVKEEMLEKGISADAIKKAQPLFSLTGSNEEVIQQLKELLKDSEIGLKGVEELEFIINETKTLGISICKLAIDVTLARGLNYYTGAIFEVSAPKQVAVGSISGGGRYDDLTGIFGLKDMSGIGISFGLDRIELVLNELDLFPETIQETTKLLFVNFGEEEARFCLNTIKKLRANNIICELYPDKSKMKKQMNYANNRAIPFVALIGSNEIEQQKFNIKNMISGESQLLSFDELVDLLK